MNKYNQKNKKDNKQRFYINRQIRASEVLCIDRNNDKIGVISLVKALNIAAENELDLVQISPSNGDTPPTCKILDYGKFKFELSKKEKATAKKQREQSTKIKEIKFRPTTDTNDLNTKAKQANAFLNQGHKIKITILFKGRELSHKEVAYETLDEFLSLIPDVQVIKDPSIDGRVLSVMAAKNST